VPVIEAGDEKSDRPITLRVELRVVAPETAKVPAKVIESFKDKVPDPPKTISPPPVKLVPAVTVTLELVKAELGILVKVFDEPDIDLLVNT